MDPGMLIGIGLIALPVLLSVTVHEYGHARVALAFGDPTALHLGRVTLNPLAHLDPLGTLMFIFGPIGWAKPVPVDDSRLNPYRIGDICVSLAGVGMNLVLLLAATGALHLLSALGVTVDPTATTTPSFIGVAVFVLFYMMQINLSLIVFNLIPLYPLDGHHVVRELLPHNHRDKFMEWQGRFGQYALLAMVSLPWIGKTFLHRQLPNPIGRLLGDIVWPAMDFLLGARAGDLAYSAYARYFHYLLR
jgi:Zn-dependent protease